MLKRMSTIFAASATLLMAAPNAHADLSVTAIMNVHGLSATEAAAAVIIADALGLDATFVIGTGRRTGQSLVVLGPAFVISHVTRRPVADVCALRRKGKGWGEIAHDLGMHPGTFNKLRVRGDFDRVAWVNLAHMRYGVAPGVIWDLERRKLGRGDWITAVALSDGDRARMDVLVGDWKKSRNWKAVAKKREDDRQWSGHSDSHGRQKGKSGKGRGRGDG